MKGSRLAQRFTCLAVLIVWTFAANVALAIDRKEIDSRVDEAVAQYKKDHPEAAEILSKAPGVLGCPMVRKAGFIVGMERGACALRIGGKTQSYYRVTGVKWGLLAGAESHGMLLVFRNPEALKKFNDRSREIEIGADFGVAVAKQSADGRLDVNSIQGDTVAFVFAQKGLMADISLDGTRFKQIPKIEGALVDILAKSDAGSVGIVITRWNTVNEITDLGKVYREKGADAARAQMKSQESCGKVIAPGSGDAVDIRYAYGRKLGDDKWKITLLTTEPLGKAANWAAAKGSKNDIGLFTFNLDAHQQGTGELLLGLEPGFNDENNPTLKTTIPPIIFQNVVASDY